MFDILNIIDYALLAFAALSVLLGVYRGSVCTGLNVLGALLSLLIARVAYPYVTEWLAGHDVLMEYLVYFSEGSSHIPTAMMEYARANVATLTDAQVLEVVTASNFPAPFDTYLLENISARVYEGQFNTLFDYFNQTVADVSLHTLSFVLTFTFSYALASLFIVLIDKTFTFPLLRACDSLVGGALGAVRGFIGLMILCTMVPLVMNMLQISLITEMVESSTLLDFFYPDNWFFSWIRSVA